MIVIPSRGKGCHTKLRCLNSQCNLTVCQTRAARKSTVKQFLEEVRRLCLIWWGSKSVLSGKILFICLQQERAADYDVDVSNVYHTNLIKINHCFFGGQILSHRVCIKKCTEFLELTMFSS